MPFLPLVISAALSVALPATLPLDEASLAKLPRAEASLTAHGQTHACEGVWLDDLAAAAGLPSGDALRGPALTLMIVAEAADGYRAAFSLGEIDPKLGNRRVLVARRCDGAVLSAQDGPLRLVVPGEARAARSVRQLQALHVVQLP
jgi:hypothetical protein